MKWDLFILLLMMLDVGWVRATCVFNVEFGLTLDCGFKKSTLFRVRNLGGVKGYVGLGFSLGDELGFAQSLTNAEDGAKRRSTPDGALSAESARSSSAGTGRSHSSPVLPWAAAGGSSFASMPSPVATVPPFKPLGGGPAVKSVATVPPFSALPPSIARIPVVNNPIPVPVISPLATPFQNSFPTANRRFQVVVPSQTMTASENTDRSSIVMGKVVESDQEPVKIMSPHTLAIRTLTEYQKTTPKVEVDIESPSPLLMGHSVQSLAQASNISVEALAAALRLREQQLLASVTIPTTTTTTTTTTTPRPTKPATVRPKYPLVGPNRVMNAPKEYYPISYDKNYDDNFTSKVELPETSFSCGDQKHFPGLYADEDLGCMVFHVCAFTDEGMVMKSFLCPESTLFDQSILKCNWWFYVDCKASKKLYDSNIPISKSYQLMKALAFFSAYSNQTANAT